MTPIPKSVPAGSIRFHSAACAQERRSTHSPSAWMSPLASATGTKASGPTSLPERVRIRSSASAPTVAPLARSTTGW
ncbi:MAG TPA: hypothetical protein VM433_09020 [Mycobacteriales bacterium]|nr:hypothetical protein [Mycobacteriales bacterium]